MGGKIRKYRWDNIFSTKSVSIKNYKTGKESEKCDYSQEQKQNKNHNSIQTVLECVHMFYLADHNFKAAIVSIRFILINENL